MEEKEMKKKRGGMGREETEEAEENEWWLASCFTTDMNLRIRVLKMRVTMVEDNRPSERYLGRKGV